MRLMDAGAKGARLPGTFRITQTTHNSGHFWRFGRSRLWKRRVPGANPVDLDVEIGEMFHFKAESKKASRGPRSAELPSQVAHAQMPGSYGAFHVRV